MEFIVQKSLSKSGSNCGANKQGGGGFQPGNTCARDANGKPIGNQPKQNSGQMSERQRLAKDAVEQNLDQRVQDGGGFTYHPVSGTSPTKGYSVSVFPANEEIIDPSEATIPRLTDYMLRNIEMLKGDARIHFGGWHNQKSAENKDGDDMVYLDLVLVLDDMEEAVSMARDNGQLKIYNLGDGEEIDTMSQEERNAWVEKQRENLQKSLWFRQERKRKHLGPGPHPNGSPQSVHGFRREAGKAVAERVIRQSSAQYPAANPRGTDTFERFLVADNDGVLEFTPERAVLHEAILSKMLEGGMPGDKRFVILGGGAASGKSTIVRNGTVNTDGVVEINADEIKGELPEYNEMLAAKDSRAAAFVHEESSHLSKQAMKRAAMAGVPYLLDGTGDSTLDSLRRKVEVARQSGYRVVAEYVTVDTEVAEQRNVARAAKTGRMVPPSALRHAHREVSRILPVAINDDLFDEARLWDTNGSEPNSEPKLVLEYVDGSLVIHDEELLERFLRKGE